MNKQEQVIRAFFARVDATPVDTRCEHTLPLFPLVLILEADGTLADACKPLVEMVAA